LQLAIKNSTESNRSCFMRIFFVFIPVNLYRIIINKLH
jgi:hypothetical protein